LYLDVGSRRAARGASPDNSSVTSPDPTDTKSLHCAQAARADFIVAVIRGECSAQATRQTPAVRGAEAGTPYAAATASKQALIGVIPTPNFLADAK